MLGGAQLIGMHRNPWWLTPEGPTSTAGTFLVGLEWATKRRARIVGKPSPAFFRAAVDPRPAPRRGPAAEPGSGDIAMVGDDVRTDVRASQRAGLRGILVLSGKHGRADLEVAARERGGRRPDAIARDLAEVVAAL